VRSISEVLAWKAWRLLYSNGMRYRLFTWIASRLRALTPAYQGGWTRSRTPLTPAPRSLRERLRSSRTTATHDTREE
jgi:L-lactate dehydrogenase complex protein LldF